MKNKLSPRYQKNKNFNKDLDETIAIKPSLIKGAGNGAFAKINIKSGRKLGEYNGVLMGTEEYNALTDQSYIFEVAKKVQDKYYTFYIDAINSGDSLRYVNGANTAKQKKKINVESYQYAGRIFFRANKDIKKGQELIIDYGDNYWH